MWDIFFLVVSGLNRSMFMHETCPTKYLNFFFFNATTGIPLSSGHSSAAGAVGQYCAASTDQLTSPGLLFHANHVRLDKPSAIKYSWNYWVHACTFRLFRSLLSCWSDFNILDEKATVAYLQVVLLCLGKVSKLRFTLTQKSVLVVSSCFSGSMLCLSKVHC